MPIEGETSKPSRQDTAIGMAMEADLSSHREAICRCPRKMRGFFAAFPSWLRPPRARLGAYACNPMSRYLRTIGIAGILFLLPKCGMAQTPEHSLRNLKGVFVLIEALSRNTVQCNVDETTIHNAINYPFSSAPFSVHTKFGPDTLGDIDFYVNLSSIYFSNADVCVSNIYVEASVSQTITLESTGTTLPAAIIKLWDGGSIISSSRQDHRERLSAEVEDLAKQFVTTWNLDNKDHSGPLTFDEFLPKARPKKGGEFADLIPKKSGGEAGADSTGAEGSTAGLAPKLPEGFVAGPAKQKLPQGWSATRPSDQPRLNLNSEAKTAEPAVTGAESDSAKPEETANSEVVIVKYRGSVNLAPFKCDAVTRSSFIERVCYDKSNSYMLIDLSGTWYHYCEIDADTVSNLMTADSMGRFYNQSIKGRFDCRTHRVPQY
jgi:hypothetical protein